MNSDQINSIIRTVLKIISGLLLAHGFSDTATLLNAPDVIGALTLILSLVWSHYSHSSPPPPSSGGSSTAGGTLGLLLAIVMPASILLTGCAGIAPGARPVVVRAEQSIAVATATFDTAVHIDDANTAFFRTNLPPFHQFCEWLRAPVIMLPLTNTLPRGLAIVYSADAVKETYKKTNSTNDYAALINSLAVVETATSQAQKFILQTSTN